MPKSSQAAALENLRKMLLLDLEILLGADMPWKLKSVGTDFADPGLSMAELLLLVPLVKVVQAMTGILRAGKRMTKSNQERNPLRQPSLISWLRQREQLQVVQPLRQLQLMDHQLKSESGQHERQRGWQRCCY